MSKECDKPRDQGQGEALRELEDQLTCVICFQLYTEPKVLACHHVFCRGCLARLVVRNERQDLEVHCSTCRQPTPVPQNGIVCNLHFISINSSRLEKSYKPTVMRKLNKLHLLLLLPSVIFVHDIETKKRSSFVRLAENSSARTVFSEVKNTTVMSMPSSLKYAMRLKCKLSFIWSHSSPKIAW